MPSIASHTIKAILPLFDSDKRSGSWQVAAVIVGSLFLTLSSFIEVPMVPVPITMQTWAVCMIGAVYGWRLGSLTVTAWLLEGALGLPVLAGGAGGFIHFIGPTGGYLIAFPLAAAVVGWLSEHGWNGKRAGLAFIAMLAGGSLCLVLGALWLSFFTGFKQAFIHGVMPFLIGDVLKSLLGAATLKAVAATGISRGK